MELEHWIRGDGEAASVSRLLIISQSSQGQIYMGQIYTGQIYTLRMTRDAAPQ